MLPGAAGVTPTVSEGGSFLETRVETCQSPSVCDFLRAQGLEPDPGAGFTVSLREDGQILACGSMDGNVIKGMAVAPDLRGQGLAERVMTELRREAFSLGLRRLFVYTKPGNEVLFRGLGFYPVAACGQALLLESTRGGLRSYLNALDRHPGPCGAVVMNCAPFTLGHRYLVEQARQRCRWLYIFVLSEEKGMFTAAQRLDMVRLGCREFSNVSVHPTEGYLISNATFPAYFLKDRAEKPKVSCALDIEIFAGRFAPALDIGVRFLGTEPFDPVTAAYNRALRDKLPPRGVQVEELPRLEVAGEPVSASRVRAALLAGERVEHLVPETTWQYLKQTMGG